MKAFEQAFGLWVLKFRWLIIPVSIILVLAAASGGQNLRFTSDYRVFFSEDNPELIAFEEQEKTFTKNDNVLFVMTPADGDVFTNKTLEAVEWLTEEAWQIPHSIRVDSLSNFQHTWADEDDLIVEDLISNASILTTSDLDTIRDIAINEPLLVKRLVSPRGHVTGVNVTIQLPGIDETKEVPEVVSFVRDLKRQVLEKYPHLTIKITGMVMLNNSFSEMSQLDMQTLIPISFAVMLVSLGILIKGFTGTFATVFVIGFSIMAAMGLGGYAGFPISPPSASAPIIILTIAIANSVHILISMLLQMKKGIEKRQAIVESLRVNLQPVTLASVTTAIGFLTMNFSDVPPFQHLGNFVAFGVLISMLLSLTFLPALMSILPVKVKIREKNKVDNMTRLGDFVISKRKPLFWGSMALIIALISFLPKNELNDVFVNYFDESVEFRTDTDYISKNLTGIYNISYSLKSGENSGINEPGFLKEVEAFAKWYELQPETLHVNTYTDIMKRINKNMHGDDESWYRLPEERDLAAQYLLLYEMSLPYGLDLNNQINIDKSATKFVVTIRTISSKDMQALATRADLWLENNTSYIQQIDASGPSLMFANIGQRNIQSMLLATTVALVLISFILMIALRSVKIGLLSLIPNLVPAAMGFGLWGVLVGEVGLALSVVTGMTLGIVVDDTVHFLSKYLRARREKNYDAKAAVSYAFTTVGMALITTSIVLILGFSVLAMSAFQLNSSMGLLTAIIIAFALIADFLFLAPLLIKFEEKRNEKANTVSSSNRISTVQSAV